MFFSSSLDYDKERQTTLFKYFVASVFVTALLYPFLRGLEDSVRDQRDLRDLQRIQDGNINGRPNGRQNRFGGTVTWHEFYHNMLQAGEVQEITIVPKFNLANVQLKPGARYKVLCIQMS